MTWQEVLDALEAQTAAQLAALARGDLAALAAPVPPAAEGLLPPALAPRAREVLAAMRAAEEQIAIALGRTRTELQTVAAMQARSAVRPALLDAAL